MRTAGAAATRTPAALTVFASVAATGVAAFLPAAVSCFATFSAVWMGVLDFFSGAFTISLLWKPALKCIALRFFA